MVKKILIVEDDQNYLNNLQAEFNQEDEQVIWAIDGEDGLNKAKIEQPDVIILDVILPKKLGLSVLEELKSDQRTKFIPTILISNYGSGANEKRAMELGATEFVVKSEVSPKQIVEIVRKYYLPTPSPSSQLI